MNFVAIVGTNARKSYNRKLLWFMKKHFSTQANIEIVEIADLPLFSEDDDVPLRIVEIAHLIASSDGVIISTPEYDHSITAALKSFIEWMSYGETHPFTNKPVMLVGASLGRQGTNNAQEHLRQIMDAPGIDALALPGNQFLVGPAAENIDTARDELTDATTVRFLDSIFQNFVTFAKLLRPMCGDGSDSENCQTLPKSDSVCSVNLGYQSFEHVLNDSPYDNDTVPSKIISPDQNTQVIEQGDGWWIEQSDLLHENIVDNVDNVVTNEVVAPVVTADATTGASMF